METFEKIKKGIHVYGTCVTSFNPLWPDAIQKAGLDFVFIDTEHISLDRSQVGHLCQTYGGRGITPIVRISRPDPFLACQMIDAGAKGVVAPYLEKEEEIVGLVGATKYRPLKGEQLKQFLSGRGEPMTPNLRDYISELNRGNICIANIESMPAVQNLDRLLSVKGLDAVFIGPHDLSVSMGLPENYDHPDFASVVEEIISKCHGKNLGVGIHFSGSAERQVHWIKKGVNIIIHSSDYALFNQRLRHDLYKIKRETGQGDYLNSNDDPHIV
ncbi:HpcH/HpaI aldolase family protein [Negadavirga shengliensis]|uniref:HpcH/HpaI aldolase/citrate lyase family protein n=1 Tax=Negadavirga shengliensis TaxID=1389218 RepID=A0ABV9T0E1_9BACT